MGFLLGLVLYIGLLFRTPLQWTKPVWFLLAFLVVPALVGLVVGMKKRKRASVASIKKNKSHVKPPDFRTGFYPAAWAMFLYAGVGMMMAHGRVGSEGNAIASFFVGLIVAIIYAGVAGSVAGVTCAACVKMRTGRATA